MCAATAISFFFLNKLEFYLYNQDGRYDAKFPRTNLRVDDLNKYTCAFEPSDRSAGQFEKPSSRLYLYAIKKIAEIVLFMITIHMLIIIHKIVECSKKINNCFLFSS